MLRNIDANGRKISSYETKREKHKYGKRKRERKCKWIKQMKKTMRKKRKKERRTSQEKKEKMGNKIST